MTLVDQPTRKTGKLTVVMAGPRRISKVALYMAASGERPLSDCGCEVYFRQRSCALAETDDVKR
jgi:hypothetical protein